MLYIRYTTVNMKSVSVKHLKRIGTKLEVFKGLASHTSGKLYKHHLKVNKRGKVVSIKASNAASRNFGKRKKKVMPGMSGMTDAEKRQHCREFLATPPKPEKKKEKKQKEPEYKLKEKKLKKKDVSQERVNELEKQIKKLREDAETLAREKGRITPGVNKILAKKDVLVSEMIKMKIFLRKQKIAKREQEAKKQEEKKQKQPEKKEREIKTRPKPAPKPKEVKKVFVKSELKSQDIKLYETIQAFYNHYNGSHVLSNSEKAQKLKQLKQLIKKYKNKKDVMKYLDERIKQAKSEIKKTPPKPKQKVKRDPKEEEHEDRESLIKIFDNSSDAFFHHWLKEPDVNDLRKRVKDRRYNNVIQKLFTQYLEIFDKYKRKGDIDFINRAHEESKQRRTARLRKSLDDAKKEREKERIRRGILKEEKKLFKKEVKRPIQRKTESKRERKEISDEDIIINGWNGPIGIILYQNDRKTYDTIESFIKNHTRQKKPIYGNLLLSFTKKYNNEVVDKYGARVLLEGIEKISNYAGSDFDGYNFQNPLLKGEWDEVRPGSMNMRNRKKLMSLSTKSFHKVATPKQEAKKEVKEEVKEEAKKQDVKISRKLFSLFENIYQHYSRIKILDKKKLETLKQDIRNEAGKAKKTDRKGIIKMFNAIMKNAYQEGKKKK